MNTTETKLWDHLHAEHGLTLTESELHEVMLLATAQLRAEGEAVHARNERLENDFAAIAKQGEADKRRLDWLEKQDVLTLDWITPDGSAVNMMVDPCQRIQCEPSLRAAIDAAARAQTGGEGSL